MPKSQGGRDVVPMHPICQQTLIANFTNSELQRHGTDVQVLLANTNLREFVDWVANKDPEFSATTAKKQRWSGRARLRSTCGRCTAHTGSRQADKF